MGIALPLLGRGECKKCARVGSPPDITHDFAEISQFKDCRLVKLDNAKGVYRLARFQEPRGLYWRRQLLRVPCGEEVSSLLTVEPFQLTDGADLIVSSRSK